MSRKEHHHARRLMGLTPPRPRLPDPPAGRNTNRARRLTGLAPARSRTSQEEGSIDMRGT